ncbi:MAG TPA: UbiH/UbiF family hydroxylase [Burkholderiales bacterium]|nr:UbiH/UbiF family hydroxylase [Burkholderiales bacterium]
MNAVRADIAIVGGALVGAALARALEGTRVALVAQERRNPTAPAAAFDSRIYAISPANAAFLATLGAWRRIPAERLTAVHAMRVFGDDGRSRLDFDAYRAGASELAWIVEDTLLQDALWASLEGQAQLELLAPGLCEKLTLGATGAWIALADGRQLDSRLVVGADGARSFVRQQAGIDAIERRYGQTAVVANFACERPHRNVAFQWFQSGPVLALLPLPGNHVSMVWSTSDAHAEQITALEPAELAAEVGAASRHELGELSLAGAVRGFPLRRLQASHSVAARVALVGDAAHVVHPLAGQGANLGFQDARVLAEILRAREPFRDPGDPRLLRRYERARAEDILAMRATVHGLFTLFDADREVLRFARNAGLNLVDRIPVLKNVLIRKAMS